MKTRSKKFYSFLIIMTLLCVNVLTSSAATQTVQVKDISSLIKNVLYCVNMQLVTVELKNDSNIEDVILEYKKPSGKVLRVYLSKESSLFQKKMLEKALAASSEGEIPNSPLSGGYIGLIMTEDFDEVGNYTFYRIVAVDKQDKQYITERNDMSSFMLKGADFNVIDKIVKLTGVTIDNTKLVVGQNTTKVLNAAVTPADAYYAMGVWGTKAEFLGQEEANPVVKINGKDKQAKILGLTPGQTTVIFYPYAANNYAQCNVIVPGIALSSKKVSVKRTKTSKLAPKVYTKYGLKSVPVTYSSSNKQIAKVDAKGVITGVNKGTAVISLSAKYGELTYKTKVTVTVTPLTK